MGVGGLGHAPATLPPANKGPILHEVGVGLGLLWPCAQKLAPRLCGSNLGPSDP